MKAPEDASAGQVVHLSGQGFSPGSKVQIVLDGPAKTVVGTVTAQPDGEFRASVTVPKTEAGHHELQVEGTSAEGRSATWVKSLLISSRLTPSLASGPNLATPVLLAISLAVPAGTWLVLDMPGRRRAATRQPGER